MSGIYGVVFFGDELNTVDISSMGKWNGAYGRDGEEVYEKAGVKLGCFLEKLSDAAGKSSPVLKMGGKIAVIDAVLFNKEELLEMVRKEARQVDSLLSDEELLLIFIDCFGMKALATVNGDFAGAIYDEQKKELVLFRDHMGVRPLFVFQRGDMVAFSTDLRGIVSLKEVDVTISEEWIFKTVAGYSTIGTERTEFEYIFCVEPSEYLVFKLGDGKVNKEKNRYWRFSSKKVKCSSDEEYQKRLRELIADAISRRLQVVSGPVGAELSGGLDSGVISILINRFGREGIYFSWSADPKRVAMEEDDERLVIEDICRQEGIICNYSGNVPFMDEQSAMAEGMRLVGVMPDMNQSPAFRYALPSYINALTLCETSQFIGRKGSKVVFTGHGGDEGVSHRGNPYELFFNGEYLSYYRHFWQVTAGQPRRAIRALKHCYQNVKETKKKFGGVFHMVTGTPNLLNIDFANRYNENDMPKNTFAFDPKSHVEKGATCNRLYNVAILGAYCGVRYLIPFMDYRLMDFALAIPRSQYLKNRVKRYIYREAFKDIMPNSLYVRSIKQSNSANGIKPNPNWLDEYMKKKREVVDILDRAYWSKYLNFEEIDAWVERGELSEEEMTRDRNMLTNLFCCAMVENLVKKAREV